MQSSSVLLDVGLSAGALAGVIGGANDVRAAPAYAEASSVVVTFCFFDVAASSMGLNRWCLLLCCDTLVFCLLCCGRSAWQNEMRIVV